MIKRPSTAPMQAVRDRQAAAGTVEVSVLLGDRPAHRVLRSGDTLRLGRGAHQDVRLSSPWVSRHQAVLAAGDGHAVFTRAPEAQGATWVQSHGRGARALGPGEAALLTFGMTWVRMHTDASIWPRTGELLDPIGTPVLLIVVGPAAQPPSAANPGELTLSAPDRVRREAGYLTLVALCAGLLRRGDDGRVPDADELSRQLARIGVVRAKGTCGNDLSRLADLLGLRDEAGDGHNISRYRLAVAAVRAGWVTADDVTKAGFR